MANVLSDFVAAQLSKASYTRLDDWNAGHMPDGKDLPALPDGWHFDADHSSYGTKDGKIDPDNQFITFYNDNDKQVVTVFKGSDNYSNFNSDLTDAGYSEWKSLRPAFDAKINDILNQINNSEGPYKDYQQPMTDGHSLGGGMAQTAALIYDLSGYGQNSLPISPDAIKDFIANGGNLNDTLAPLAASWMSAGKSDIS